MFRFPYMWIIFITLALLVMFTFTFQFVQENKLNRGETKFETVEPIFHPLVIPLTPNTTHVHVKSKGPKHIEYMSYTLGVTKLWFRWVDHIKARSLLFAGGTIGYAISGHILSHDDDIDVTIHADDLHHLDDLYKKGKPSKIRHCLNLLWKCREVTLWDGTAIRVAKHRWKRGWYKWITDTPFDYWDIGGLDIMGAEYNEDLGSYVETAYNDRVVPSHADGYFVPMVYNNIELYVSPFEETILFLNKKYGLRWQKQITTASPYYDKMDQIKELSKPFIKPKYKNHLFKNQCQLKKESVEEV